MPYDTLSIDDIRQLSALQTAKDPRAEQILKTLSPDELTAYKEISSTDKLGPGLGGNDLGFGVALGAGTAGLAGLAPAGALGAAAKAAIPSAENLGSAAKWGALGYGISKLPEGLRMPAEMMLILGGAKGSGRTLRPGAGAAVAEEEAAMGGLDPKKMGHLSDEEALAAFKNQTPKGTRTMPTPVAPRQPARAAGTSSKTTADVRERVQGGGGVGFENNGESVRPNGPISSKGVGPRRPEFAPGNTNKTSPETYIANENKFAESQGDQGSVDRARQMLEDIMKLSGESSKGYAKQGGMPAEPKAPSRRPTKRRSPK